MFVRAMPESNEYQIALLKQIASGDREAFRAIYAQFSSRVYNTALSYLQNEEDAEETTQDVFLEVYSSAEQFQERSSVSTWIYRITVNKCLDKLRYRKRKKRLGAMLRIFGESGEVLHDVPHFEHPGIELERKESAVILFEAIDQLPENQQTAYILTYIEELPGKEVAEVMKVSVKAVESSIQRAKANLRKIIERTELGPKE